MEEGFKDYLSKLDQKGKAETYVKIMCTPSKEQVDKTVSETLSSMTREKMESNLTPILSAQTGMSDAEISEYLSSMKDEDIEEIFAEIYHHFSTSR